VISDDQFYPYWKPKTKNLAEEDLQDARLNAETGMGWEAWGPSSLLVNWQGCECHLIGLVWLVSWLDEGKFIPAEQLSSTNAGEQVARGD
jgi:hypothetical protein